jgi:chromate transport protein ChrA
MFTRLPNRVQSISSPAIFAFCLLIVPLLAAGKRDGWLPLFDSFYRTGSLVFGGGHVVLPLLQAEVVPKGWVDNNTFLAGYGIAQALPGPLFSFAAYLGAAKSGSPTGWLAGLWCLFAILLPPMLLVTGLLPLWNRLRASATAQSLLAGANATVVGILLAALYQPIWTSAIDSAKSLALALILFAGLQIWKKFIFPAEWGIGRFEKIGIIYPHLTAPFVGVVETVCGLLLIFGLFTRPAALLLLINISVAILTTKVPLALHKGFWPAEAEARADYSMFMSTLFLLIVWRRGDVVGCLVDKKENPPAEGDPGEELAPNRANACSICQGSFRFHGRRSGTSVHLIDSMR